MSAVNASQGTLSTFTRRAILVGLPVAAVVFWATRKKPIADSAGFVLPHEKWKPLHFLEFVASLPNEERLALKKVAGLLDESATIRALKSADEDARELQKQALWLSSNIITYPFKSVAEFDYHETTKWACAEAGLDKDKVNSLATFHLERELQKLVFAAMWDKLTPQQREALLKNIDKNGAIKDTAAVAAMSGSAAVALLSATVFFAGFAFYTTMSLTIAAVASAIGVTLPFFIYSGASTIVAVLSGPIGWGVLTLAAIGSLALAGRADVQKTTALVSMLHAMKVQALIENGVSEKKIFDLPDPSSGK